MGVAQIGVTVMVGRILRVTGTALAMAVVLVAPVLATATATPAAADTVINGCTIVSNPTTTDFTDCPNVNFSGFTFSGFQPVVRKPGRRHIRTVPKRVVCRCRPQRCEPDAGRPLRCHLRCPLRRHAYHVGEYRG